MMRILFFFMGVPMMIMSFFEAIDVLPYVTNYNLMVDGKVVELSETEMQGLQEQVVSLFEGSRTMPAFGVVSNDMYQEDVKNGYFVSLKFDCPIQINDLPFDELVFKVDKDFQGFNLMRGMNGIFQGRCIYIDLQDHNMTNIFEYIDNLESVKNISIDEPVEDISDEAEQIPTEDFSDDNKNEVVVDNATDRK